MSVSFLKAISGKTANRHKFCKLYPALKRLLQRLTWSYRTIIKDAALIVRHPSLLDSIKQAPDHNFVQK